MKSSTKFSIAVYCCIAFFANACKNSNTAEIKNNSENYFDLKKYFTDEITVLKKENPSLTKNFTEGEEVKTEKTKVRDWNAELASFLELEMNNKDNKGFTKSIDSSGNLMKVNYAAVDSNQLIEFVSISYRDNKIQLIEINTQSKSWIVDRKTHYSFQPMRGYSVSNWENYLWSSPKRQDLSVVIHNANDLEN